VASLVFLAPLLVCGQAFAVQGKKAEKHDQKDFGV